MSYLIEYDPKRHRYFVDGRELISVTDALQKAGYIDTAWFTEYHRWRGSRVHELTMLDDTEGLDLRRVESELRGYVRAWRRYRAETGQTSFTHIEYRVYSPDSGYAGTLDRANSVITDIKTSVQGAVAPWARLQTAAYGHALRPNHWFERRGVALKPNGRYSIEVYPASEFGRDLAEFHQALERAA